MTRVLVTARMAAVLLAASSILGGPGPAGSAAAQTPSTLAGVEGRALASGVAVSYRPEGLLPIASPVDLSSPDALATIASGPSTFARASVADPGDVVANPDALFALASSDYEPGTIPPYPYRVSAASGVGAPSAESNPGPGLNARVAADTGGSTAQSTMPAVDGPGVATAGSISSFASTSTDGATVTVHARTEVSDFNLLGVLTIESIVTDVTATADGTQTTVSGGTTITGAEVAGQPATIDASGVHTEPPSGPTDPILGGVLGSGDGSVNDALASAGITVTLVGAVAQDGETSGQLTAAGLQIVLEQSEETLPVLGQLGELVPPSDAPFVEDLLVLAEARHLEYIEVGRAMVSLTALTATPQLPVPRVPPSTGPGLDAGSLVGAPSAAGSTTAGGAPVATAGPGAPIDTEPTSGTTLAAGIGALAVLALLAQPFAGSRLAHAAAALLGPGAAEHCPREERQR